MVGNRSEGREMPRRQAFVGQFEFEIDLLGGPAGIEPATIGLKDGRSFGP